MKLAWAVYWRVFVLLLVFSVLVVLPLKNSAFITEPRFFVWKPPVLWGSFAALLLLAHAVLPNGLVYVLWGRRLNQGLAFWRKLSFAAAALFVCLAVVSVVVAQTVSFQSWANFKTVAPLAGLLLFSLIVPRRLALEPQPSVAPDAQTAARR